MNVLIGIPTSGAPSQPFLESLAAVEIPASVTHVSRIVVQGNFVPAQRELIADKAIAQGVDALIMCDDDMVLPPHAFRALLEVLNSDERVGLAGALYYSRDGFRPMTVTDWNSENTTTASVPAFDAAPVRVDGVGFGCVAISAKALMRLAPPYFPGQVYMETEPPRVRVCNEDYLFCATLRSTGYDVVLHAGVRCGHYDRTSGVTVPSAWEPPEVTSQRRVAVMENGAHKLVPFRELPGAGEIHQRTAITYIRPSR
jgi:hypothetical protein